MNIPGMIGRCFPIVKTPTVNTYVGPSVKVRTSAIIDYLIDNRTPVSPPYNYKMSPPYKTWPKKYPKGFYSI